MATRTTSPILDRLVNPLSECFTAESAGRLLKLRADPKLQSLVEELGRKCNEGTMTAEEEAEYARYVSFGTFIAVLKAKVRQILA